MIETPEVEQVSSPTPDEQVDEEEGDQSDGHQGYQAKEQEGQHSDSQLFHEEEEQFSDNLIIDLENDIVVDNEVEEQDDIVPPDDIEEGDEPMDVEEPEVPGPTSPSFQRPFFQLEPAPEGEELDELSQAIVGVAVTHNLSERGIQAMLDVCEMIAMHWKHMPGTTYTCFLQCLLSRVATLQKLNERGELRYSYRHYYKKRASKDLPVFKCSYHTTDDFREDVDTIPAHLYSLSGATTKLLRQDCYTSLKEIVQYVIFIHRYKLPKSLCTIQQLCCTRDLLGSTRKYVTSRA